MDPVGRKVPNDAHMMTEGAPRIKGSLTLGVACSPIHNHEARNIDYPDASAGTSNTTVVLRYIDNNARLQIWKAEVGE